MKPIKSSKNDLTMENIEKLIDRKFDQRLLPINRELTNINTKILGIYGEIDGVKQQIVGLDFKISNLENKMDKCFEIVFDGLTNLGTIFDLDHEKRIKRLENKVFAQ